MQGRSGSIGSNGLNSWRIGEDVLALTLGLGAGAGLMFLCDPLRGRSRRKRLIAQTAGLLHQDKHKVEKRAKDMLNRVQGFVAEAASTLAPEAHVTDEVLAQRVRSRMGHVLSNPKAVRIDAHNGVITLEGKLTHAEKRMLREQVSAIPGVTRVDDRLRSRSVFAPGLLLGIAAGITMFRKSSSLNLSQTHGASS